MHGYQVLAVINWQIISLHCLSIILSAPKQLIHKALKRDGCMCFALSEMRGYHQYGMLLAIIGKSIPCELEVENPHDPICC